MNIETERFWLRELTEADATPRYLSWLANPETSRFIVAARTTHGLDTLADYIRQRVNRSDILFLGIFEKRSGLHIGNIKFEPIDSTRGYAIMGILIGDPDSRGKGVAGEVLLASLRWLKLHRGIRQVLLGVDSANSGAIRAYHKAGFVVMESPHLHAAGPNVLTMGCML